MSFETTIREVLREVLREELPALLAVAAAPPAVPGPEELLTVAEVAQRCKVRPPAVRQWIRSGRLVSKKGGHRHLVAVADLQRFLAAGEAERGAAISTEDHVASVLGRIQRGR